MAEQIKDLFKRTCVICTCTSYDETTILGECANCGHPNGEHTTVEDNLPQVLNQLVLAGKTDKIILHYLQSVGIDMSFGTLRRRLSEFGIHRHENYAPAQIHEAVEFEMQQSDNKSGYRRVYNNIRQKHELKVKRDDIVIAMRQLDPNGPKARKARRLVRRVFICDGPNSIWSIDGHDKLASFSIYIHGALDAWSRRVIWCNTYTTNKDPRVIAHFFINALVSNKVIPCQTRVDPGTENTILAEVQMYLRRNGMDEKGGTKSNLVAKSKFNQKIECFWSGLYKRCSRSWWETFVTLQRQGKLEDEHREAFLFIFFPLVEQSVNDYISWWNGHTIRRQAQVALPTGASPNDMYYLPHVYGGEFCGHTFEQEDVAAVRDYHQLPTKLASVISNEYNERATAMLNEHGIQNNFENALNAYNFLIQHQV